jgi:hypothetical protein
MARSGWSNLLPRKDDFQGPGAFRIDAHSEYVPPLRVGWKPYGPVTVNRYVFPPDDPFGWQIHELDEALRLQPGLHQIAKQLMTRLKQLQGVTGAAGARPAGVIDRGASTAWWWPPCV